MHSKHSSRGFTLIELMIVVAILFILVAAAAGGTGRGFMNLSHGEGQKIGQIVKLSKQGLMRQTWEAQLIRGGMNAGSGSFGAVPFNFTIEGDEQAAKVQRYMQDQTEVVVSYRIEGLYWPSRSESGGHFLASIEPAKK